MSAPARKRGRPVTTGRTYPVNVLLSREEYRRLQDRADRNGVTLASYIRGCALAIDSMAASREAKAG